MRVIAVLCSDLHISHRCPVARSAEPSWYEAQERPLAQLRQIADEHKCPVICSGDVSDRPNEPAECINFMIDNLPKMYSIWGQHDVFYHSESTLDRTAYGTLIREGTITNITDMATSNVGSYREHSNAPLSIHGFPWDAEIEPYEDTKFSDHLHVAVIHRYLWTKTVGGYPHAPLENRLDQIADSLSGYDVAQFGDNHIPFAQWTESPDLPSVVNCGPLLRRSISERATEPSVWLLHDDASVERIKLDTSEDKWLDAELEDAGCDVPDMTGLISELESLEADSLDFRAAVLQWLRDNDRTMGERTKTILREIIG